MAWSLKVNFGAHITSVTLTYNDISDVQRTRKIEKTTTITNIGAGENVKIAAYQVDSGYSFRWSNSYGSVFDASEQIDAVASYREINVYAVSSSLRTIQYDANGGYGAPVRQDNITPGTSVTISTTIPIRANYEFIGWSTNSSATTAEYLSGHAYTIYNSMTLYAVWKRIYSVTLLDNDGTFIMSRTTTGSFTFPSYSKTGYTFKGWSLSSTPTYVTYYASNTYTVSSNISVYAVYTVDLSFSADGASNVPDTIPGYIGSGSSYNFTIPDNVPVKAGYTFRSWGLYEGTTPVQYQPSTTINRSSNTTLIAIFDKITYKVTLLDNDGKTVIDTATTTGLYTFPSHSKDGYNFKGWSNASDALSVHFTAGAKWNLTSDLTAYAVYSLTLSFAADEESSNIPSPIERIIGNNNTYKFTIPSDVPTKAGHTFKCWNHNDAYGELLGQYDKGTSIVLGANTTLYAQWEITTYNVNLSLGTGVESVHITYTTAYGEYSPPDGITENANYAVKSGGIFKVTSATLSAGYQNAKVYFYDDPDGINLAATVDIGASRTISYAQYAVVRAERIPTYTVTLSLGRGISSVNIAYQAADGSITTVTGITSSRTVAVKSGGAFRVTSATLSTGYQNASVDFYDSPDFTTPIATVSINESRTINFTQYANVVSSKVTLTKFAFHFSGSTDVDGNYFTTGSSVSHALTADSWNSLNQKITQVEAALGITQTSYTSVSRDDTISATLFNQVRSRINGLTSHGTLPTTQSANDTITPSLFIGSVSLKKALNDAIDAFNNN